MIWEGTQIGEDCFRLAGKSSLLDLFHIGVRLCGCRNSER